MVYLDDTTRQQFLWALNSKFAKQKGKTEKSRERERQGNV